MSQKPHFGLTGLAVMGQNLARNVAHNGFPIAVHNRTASKVDEFIADFGTEGTFVGAHSLKELVEVLEAPRTILIMVKAGGPVDAVINELATLLSPGDTLIDGGNSLYTDTQRRNKDLTAKGLNFLGVGVSGGEEGALKGPSIMPGGQRDAYDRIAPIFEAISAKVDGTPCVAYIGADGAGHYVKMIHNGIEYADMQMIAEIYGIMRDGLKMQAPEIGQAFAKWNKGKLDSYLIEITSQVLQKADDKTGKPLVDLILDKAGQKGTGKWSVIEAQELAIPATGIEAAVAARILSSMKDQRVKAEALYGKRSQKLAVTSQASVLRQLESALYAAKICAYAQGFAVLQAASEAYHWNLPMGRIAQIWREGCIIRSQFLDLIASTFAKHRDVENLLATPEFVTMMKADQKALRRTVADAALAGLPIPALSAALAFFDSYRQARGTANVIQAQRDFFGAHTYERTDGPGSYHTQWE